MSTLRVAFSPDSDDLFMFWPLLCGRIPTDGLRFEATRADTDTLNRRAFEGEGDIVAVSIATYPLIADRYLLLPHGGSVGRGYGPMVVAPKKCELDELRGKRIAVPGITTTAYLVLRLLLSSFEPVVVPIQPYGRVFQSMRAGEVDAALVIHEGRLTFEREGFAAVRDVGVAWADATGGLPLPLGGNVIRRELGPELIAQVSHLLRESIRWALANREALIDEILFAEARVDLTLSRDLLDRYLAMYANHDTLAYPEDARRAIDELFARARAAKLIPGIERVEWAP